MDLISAHKWQLLILSAMSLDHGKRLDAKHQVQFLQLFRQAWVPVCSKDNCITNTSSKHMFYFFLLAICEHALIECCVIVSILLSAGKKTIASKVWISSFLFPKPNLHSVWSFHVNVNCLHCRFVWYKSATSNPPWCSQHSSFSLHFSGFTYDLLNLSVVCNQWNFWGKKGKVTYIGSSFTNFGF